MKHKMLWDYLSRLASPRLSGIACLLLVSLGILHIHQDLATASFQSFHSEDGWLQHLVAMRLNTYRQTIR